MAFWFNTPIYILQRPREDPWPLLFGHGIGRRRKEFVLMSDAIIVNEIYKKFGKPAETSFWKNLLKLKGQTGNAKTNGKGKKRLVVA
ncbi:MAG: hypothetical protein IH859_09585, partial [Chloroflexi bacterium]|nr:hypothetical protein [Chloroflexota bacterium]